MFTSDAADEYSILSHQRYRYARVICNIILEIQAGKYTKAPLERMGRPERVKTVNDSASSILAPSSGTSKQLTQTYIAKWREWQEDIKERRRRRRNRYEGKKRLDASQKPSPKGRDMKGWRRGEGKKKRDGKSRRHGEEKKLHCKEKRAPRESSKGRMKNWRGSRKNSTTTKGTRLCVWIGFPLHVPNSSPCVLSTYHSASTSM
ncbi:hypothetical protein EV421DRAFT_511119 [Armillaria borealis]|uniref:Uncharacterized protein n=1 Tax=Armillaria borealis TaxID=47425 RepID=A0AA39JJ80_9AGAR|nr:hypothetical protein EV421DRAFT_511119 [Armillaria borealis]